MENIKTIAKNISEKGLKVTPQRVAVMQALYKLHHPRAEEIFREVSATIPGLSPTTVYNVLDILVEKGIIRRAKTETGGMRYDAVPDHHHHLYSTTNDRVEDYFDPELDALLTDYFSRKNIAGFRLQEIKLQIMGDFDEPQH